MINTAEHHHARNRNIRVLTEELERQADGVLIMSLDNVSEGSVGGRMFMVPPSGAAPGIVDKTHRIATPEEQRSWETAQVKARARIVRLERAAGRRTDHLVPEEEDQPEPKKAVAAKSKE